MTSAHLRGLKCDHNLNSSPCHRCRDAPAIFRIQRVTLRRSYDHCQ
nr:MAG TPA: cytidine deaminase-like protein [Caudoviricetes sp.]